MSKPIRCTVGILTYNSDDSLERCLASVEGFAEIIIADGGSTDGTLAIASRYGCRIIEQSRQGMPIESFALEKNRLFDAATNDWFFCLDSDEFMSPELKEEIRLVCARPEPEHYAYRVPWRTTSPDGSMVYRPFKTYYQYRFFNKQSGGRFVRKIHERVEFDERKFPPGTLKGAWYAPLTTIGDFAAYRKKVHERVASQASERYPRSLAKYLSVMVRGPVQNIAKQVVKTTYLHARYPSREVVPLTYEYYKLYGQAVFVREYTLLYIGHLRSFLKGFGKIGVYSIAYILRYFWCLLGARPEVSVLMYHAVGRSDWKLSIKPEVFEQQIVYLAHRKKPVTLQKVVAHAWGEEVLADGSVGVSFDDGYHDLIETVLPIIKKHQVPITVFVTADLDLKTNRHGIRRLSEDDMRVLADEPLVSLESHGTTHRNLAALSPNELAVELSSSSERISRFTQARPRFFAYPFGSRSPHVESAVREAGYDAAFAITEGLIAPGDELFCLKRIQVDRTMSFLLFRVRLTHATTLVKWVASRFRKLDSMLLAVMDTLTPLRRLLRRIRFKTMRLVHFLELVFVVADWKSRMRVLGLIFSIDRKDGRSRSVEIAFAHAGVRRSICIEGGIREKRVADLVVLWEMFVRKQYAVPKRDLLSVIVDVGGNIGASTLYFLLYYPNAHVYVVEPNPDLFSRLRLSFGAESRVTLINAAMCPIDGDVTFYPNRNHLSGSLSKRTGTLEGVKVPGISLDTLIERFGIEQVDLLKFDIEGGEWGMLQGFTKRVSVAMMVGELHYDLMEVKREELGELLKGFKYTEDMVHESRSVIIATRV